MKIKRRDFIKTTALVGTAGALFPVPTLNAFTKAAIGSEILASLPGGWIPSTCQGCTTWCPIEIYVQDGRAVRVRGNQHAKANSGYVCPRGHMIPKQVYDPDRIKVPLKRTNPEKGRGIDPKFVPISWDEALELLADKMMELRNNNETHKFLVMRGRYSTYQNGILYGSLPKIFGSPNNISHSAICAEAEKMGPYFTEGFWGYRDYDLDRTKYLVLWGVDPVSSNRQLPNAIRKFGKVLDNATVVTIDPRLNTSSIKSHEWMPVKPGEDGALASAIAHVILTKGLWNKDFVGDFNDGQNRFKVNETIEEDTFHERFTHGLIKWWNIELKDKKPEWAEEITGIKKEQIIRVAEGMGKATPYVAVWLGPGPVMSPRGTYTSIAVHALNGLLGSVDREGGTLRHPSVSAASQPSDDPYLDEIAKAGRAHKKIDQRGYKNFPALARGVPGSGVVTNNVANAILNEDPYDIKVAIGYWNNFNFAGQEGQRWDRAMAKVPFFAHIVTHASEMTQFADIVLPAAHHATEKLTAQTCKANLHSHISIQQPVIKKMWDVKMDETEIVWMLGEKLAAKGWSNLLDYLKNEFKDPETGESPKDGTHFAEVVTKVRTKPAYDTIGGWEEFKKKGVVNFGPYEFRKKWDNFETVTKKFEFYSETLKKGLTEHAEKHNTTVDDILETCNYTARGELAFVPHYEPPLRFGSREEYPLDFIDYKSRLNREGRSQNITWYYEFKHSDPGDKRWDDVVKINSIDAEKRGISDGDKVKVSSVTGSFIATARIWEGTQPGTVAKAFGQGHWAYGRIAAKDYHAFEPRGGNNNDLLPDEYDRLSGSSARNGGYTGVRIEKV